MADSGNGDSTHQKVSRFGAIRLVLEELGANASVEAVRERVAQRFGYTIDDRDVQRVRRLWFRGQ